MRSERDLSSVKDKWSFNLSGQKDLFLNQSQQNLPLLKTNKLLNCWKIKRPYHLLETTCNFRCCWYAKILFKITKKPKKMVITSGFEFLNFLKILWFVPMKNYWIFQIQEKSSSRKFIAWPKIHKIIQFSAFIDMSIYSKFC